MTSINIIAHMQYQEKMDALGYVDIIKICVENNLEINDFETLGILTVEETWWDLDYSNKNIINEEWKERISTSEFYGTYIKEEAISVILKMASNNEVIQKRIRMRKKKIERRKHINFIREERRKNKILQDNEIKNQENDVKFIQGNLIENNNIELDIKNEKQEKNRNQNKPALEENSLWYPVIGFGGLFAFSLIVIKLNEISKGLGTNVFLLLLALPLVFYIVKHIFREGVSESPRRAMNFIKTSVLIVIFIALFGAFFGDGSDKEVCMPAPVGCF